MPTPMPITERLELAQIERGGEAGSVRLVVDRVAGRTRIVDLECTGPVQVLRCQYLDPAAPDMASVTIASPSGGVLQGDRLRIAVEVRPAARLMLDTQSATRLYRMPDRPARIEMRFDVGADAWLEYLPDPYIPFAGSNTTIETVAIVDASATVLLGEVVACGRRARGEVFQMLGFHSVVSAVRPAGELLFSDATTLEADASMGDPGMLGPGSALGSLYAIAPGVDPEWLRGAIGSQRAAGVNAGASTLPNAAGAWLRLVADDTASATCVVAAGRDAVRTALLGSATPASRRP
jgi:urease accessory protein